MRRAALLACLAALAPAAALAAEPPPQPMAAQELDGLRAGILLPNGFEVGLGALVSTYVDGQLALQTRFTLTEQGMAQTIEAGQLTADLTANAAAKGLNLGAGATGLLVNGVEGGATAVLHDVGAGYIANLVINNAMNRDIRQNTEITLNIPELDALQAQYAAQAQVMALQSSMANALKDAAR